MGPDFKKCKFLHRGFYIIYCIPGNLDKGSVQFVNTVYKWRTNIIRGPLISQFWQDKISRGSIFATVTGKHKKRALKFAI